MTIDDVIDDILTREGRSFTNDPADHGGPTKFGITLVDLCEWRGRPHLGSEDVEMLTEAEAREIYRQRYVLLPGFDQIRDEWLQAFMVDTGVLQGVRVAVRLLQRALSVPDDGVLGPVTLAAIDEIDPVVLKRAMIQRRVAHLASCALSDVPSTIVSTTNLKFLRGWLNRATSFI